MKRRRNNKRRYPPRPKDVNVIRFEGGLRAKSQDGAFGDTWWGREWVRTLESFGWEARMERGQSYARTGHVLDLAITPGQVEGRVQGNRPLPYHVEISLTTLTDDEWQNVLSALSEQALFSAQLLAGEMPPDIEQVFRQSGLSLFPRSHEDLQTSCSCPDWANPCKHIAAVYYLLAEKFDEDPFLLFYLRGRERDQIIQALRAQRAAAAEEVLPDTASKNGGDALSLEAAIDQFWDVGETLDDVPVGIGAPQVPFPIMRQLGDPPREIGSELREIYRLVTEQVMRLAFGDRQSNGGAVKEN